MNSKKEILQAVIKALTKTGTPSAGKMVVPGIVRTCSTIGHISDEAIKQALSDYIKQGYFEIVNEKIKITELGIANLYTVS